MPTGTLGEVLKIGEWSVNSDLDTISRGHETHKLEPRTMQLLLCLANSAGEVVSLERLLNEVWSGVIVGSASVYQAVSQLRKLLGDVEAEATYIATIPRKGYRLIAKVERLVRTGGTNTGSSSDVSARLSAGRNLRAKPVAFGLAALIAIILIGAIAWKTWQPNSSVDADSPLDSTASIVVLPFIDLSAEKADQSFCDGLTEELSNWLSQIPTIRVVARTSAFSFRGQGEDVRKIGKALNTNHILEGSMRRDGNRMRITVQLVDARNGYHLWSENFDRSVNDAIAIQEDIARSVAQTLQVRLTTESERQFALRRSADPQAYQLFLLALYYDQQLTPESSDRAVDLYQQVVKADPRFALGYARLAHALWNQGYFHDAPPANVAAAMEPLIASALRIDDRLSMAYAVRGILRASQSRQQEALDDLHHALSLDPSNMSAFAAIGRIGLLDGRPREALSNYDNAAVLDPLNSTLQIQRCTALDDLAHYDEASKACERARLLQPGNAAAADRLAWLAESRGRIDEALRWNTQALKVEPRGDMDLYWTRATLFLSIARAAPARAAIELGRNKTNEKAVAESALVRVVYCEGGAEALRRYVDSVHLDQSPTAVGLLEAAYSRLLLGDAAAAKRLIARAQAAPDWLAGFAELPWYARGERAMGISYRVDLAAAEIQLGDRRSAERELNTVLIMVNRMIASGVERYATYELRAKIYAMKGQGDEAMVDLTRSANLGWRRAWWAVREPYFASLRDRNDFRTLMTQVNQANDQLAAKMQNDPTAD